jgi:hypothetical protein
VLVFSEMGITSVSSAAPPSTLWNRFWRMARIAPVSSRWTLSICTILPQTCFLLHLIQHADLQR